MITCRLQIPVITAPPRPLAAPPQAVRVSTEPMGTPKSSEKLGAQPGQLYTTCMSSRKCLQTIIAAKCLDHLSAALAAQAHPPPALENQSSQYRTCEMQDSCDYFFLYHSRHPKVLRFFAHSIVAVNRERYEGFEIPCYFSKSLDFFSGAKSFAPQPGMIVPQIK